MDDLFTSFSSNYSTSLQIQMPKSLKFWLVTWQTDGPLTDGSSLLPWIMVPAALVTTVCQGWFSNEPSKYGLPIGRDDSFENHQSDNQHGDTCFDSWYSGCREPRTNGSASKNCRNEIAVSDGAIYKGRHRIGNRSARITFELDKL